MTIGEGYKKNMYNQNKVRQKPANVCINKGKRRSQGQKETPMNRWVNHVIHQKKRSAIKRIQTVRCSQVGVMYFQNGMPLKEP